MIKGQDIVVLAVLMEDGFDRLAYAELGKAACLSASEAHAAVKRLQEAALVNGDRRPMKRNAMEFLVHGLRYAFPMRPTGGSILWKGKDITVANDKELTLYRREKIGFIFQRYHLISDLTARENVEIAAAIVKNPLSADEVLEMVGLGEKANSYPSQMSGGEQQRVCIARALVKQSDILLCDEPTGALDTENAKQVISVLQKLTQQRGIPVMMITHNPCFSALAGHCITMSNGIIVEEVYQPFPLDVESIVLR